MNHRRVIEQQQQQMREVLSKLLLMTVPNVDIVDVERATNVGLLLLL